MTFSSTFGGWELKWRVAVDKNSHQSGRRGPPVRRDVIDPELMKKTLREKASEKCAYEASSLESLLKEAQGWSTCSKRP